MRAGVLGALLAAGRADLGQNEINGSFEWGDVTPSQDLVFHKCFGEYECARLDVPMNWNRTDGKGSRVAVAIMKMPARVPITDERYGGAILLNPGGPGGSGVNLLFRYGEKIQAIVDATVDPPSSSALVSENNQYFDVLSFDPRGMNNTTPQVICFPDLAAREAWDRDVTAEGTMTSSDVAFATKWARYTALGGSCTARMKNFGDDEDNILEHISTPNVVGDMVAIVEALGEWREKEALRLLDTSDGEEYPTGPVTAPQKFLRGPVQSSAEKAAAIERTKWKKGEEKLQYWGFSYGTLIGATFAALQPQRVGRIILDGVVDGEDYYSLEFKSDLIDTEAVWQKFFHYCALAGPKNCPFSSSPSDTEASLRQEFDSLLSSLKKQPIAVLPSTESLIFYTPDIVTASDLLFQIQKSIYTPLVLWPALAGLLRDLSNGNGTSLAIAKQKVLQRQATYTECEEPYSPSCHLPRLGDDPMKSGAVLCSDGPRLHVSAQEYLNTTLRLLEEQSPLFGAAWAEIGMQCIAWDVDSAWKYPGTFKDIETAHPILLIGTTGDPVCPLASAHKMAAAFPGSVALEQTSEGHCSISSASVCSARHIRAYFQTGILPEKGTVCDVERQPFEGLRNISQLGWEGEDEKLWDAVKDVRGFI